MTQTFERAVSPNSVHLTEANENWVYAANTKALRENLSRIIGPQAGPTRLGTTNAGDASSLFSNVVIQSESDADSMSSAFRGLLEPRKGSRERVLQLAYFDGFVEAVTEGDSFSARLVDRMYGQRDKRASFAFSEVSIHDRKLVVPGAVFYWSIGYIETSAGERRRSSRMIFRRLPSLAAAPSTGEVDELFGGVFDEDDVTSS